MQRGTILMNVTWSHLITPFYPKISPTLNNMWEKGGFVTAIGSIYLPITRKCATIKTYFSCEKTQISSLKMYPFRIAFGPDPNDFIKRQWNSIFLANLSARRASQ